MWIAVYKFSIHPDKTEEFRIAWRELTKLIYRYENSLGSRLHRVDEQTYIAYAQWPDKETYDKSGNRLPKAATDFRNKMKDACMEITTLFQMEMTDDLLFDS